MDRYYHEKARLAEAAQHRSRFEHGADIEVGRTYKGIWERSGHKISAPFTALVYEDGTLLIGAPERDEFSVIEIDAVDVNGYIYLDHLRGVFKMKRPLPEIIMGDDGDLERVIMASQMKWFFRMNEKQARVFVEWYRLDRQGQQK